MSKVVLFGSGRGAVVAHRFLARDSEHTVCGFTVDRKYLSGETFRDLPLVPFEEVESRFPPDEYKMFVVLGYQRMNRLRAQKYLAAKEKGYGFISYVSSHFYRAEDLDVGENCFILDNQSISLDVRIGNNVVMWSSNHIGDLSRIDDHAWIASHVTLAAGVEVGSHSFLGVGATVSGNVKLASSTFVGAHAFVASNTEENGVRLAVEAAPAELDSGDFMRIMTARGKL